MPVMNLARERLFVNARAAVALTLAAALAFSGAFAFEADAKKKGKKKKRTPAALTATSAAPLLPGSSQTATVNCPGKTHVTGGGLSVDQPYSANGTDTLQDDSGTRSIHFSSHPSGPVNWSAGAAAFGTPAIPGTLTGNARCERNTFGKLATISSVSGSVPPDTLANVRAGCTTPNTHVVGGGFTTDTPGDLANLVGIRLEVLQSRRTSNREWTVTALNPTAASGSVNVTAYIACEFDRGSRTVSETFSTAAIAENGRAAATATCGSRQHVVSGGFQVSPLTSGTNLASVGIDQLQPVGNNGWQTGLYEYPGPFVAPAGASLTTYAYCKPDKPPKKPKPKKTKIIVRR